MRAFFRLSAVAAVAVLSVSALVATPSHAKREAKGLSLSVAGLPSGAYALDTSHASIIFSISHLGFSEYKGRFNTFDGTLMLNAGAPEQSGVKITIDMNSVDTNNRTLEGKLVKEAFFDTAKFPTATFTSTKFEKLSDSTGRLTGDLSLKGVTRPVVLDVRFNGAGENPYAGVPTLGFQATGSIKRSEFGITEYVPSVGDEVDLLIDVEFNQVKEEKK